MVDGVDKVDFIDWDSFRKEDIITSQIDNLQFTTKSYEGRIWKPGIESEIIVYYHGEKIFAGVIIKVTESIRGKLISYDVECSDYTYTLNRKLVFDTYESMAVEDIVTDIISTYTTGFTVANVQASGVTLEYILFNYKKPSDCIQQLAELIGFDWYIDYNKDIHFFPKTTGEVAPFDLTDTNGNYVFNSLEVNDDNKQIRNIVYVRGGEYVGDSRSDKVGTGDGTTKSFKLPYRYDVSPTVTVGGVGKTVGVDFIDDPTSFDCLWNYQEKVIKFNSAPGSGDVVVTGSPLIVVLVKAKNSASVATYGEHEWVVVDKLIKTKEAARQRAQAEFTDYALPIKKATFKTARNGLRSGQHINIQSDIRTLNQDFTINKVITTTKTPERLDYKIECSTARVIGIVEFLMKQIDDTNKKVGVFRQEGEVLDITINLEDIDTMTFAEELHFNQTLDRISLVTLDTMVVGETLIRMIKDSPPTWVYAPYFPASDADRKRPAFFNRGCNFVA